VSVFSLEVWGLGELEVSLESKNDEEEGIKSGHSHDFWGGLKAEHKSCL